MLNDVERDAVFFIADISGDTKFIFSNEKEAAHNKKGEGVKNEKKRADIPERVSRRKTLFCVQTKRQ